MCMYFRNEWVLANTEEEKRAQWAVSPLSDDLSVTTVYPTRAESVWSKSWKVDEITMKPFLTISESPEIVLNK